MIHNKPIKNTTISREVCFVHPYRCEMVSGTTRNLLINLCPFTRQSIDVINIVHFIIFGVPTNPAQKNVMRNVLKTRMALLTGKRLIFM